MTKDELMAAIAERSVEEGECVLWLGGSAKVPHVHIQGKKTNIRMLLALLRGDPIVPGSFFGCSCGNPKCIAEEHIAQRSRKQHAAHFGKQGAYSGPAKTAKMAATKRAKSKLDDEKVAAIRASTKTLKELGEEFGVASSYVGYIRAGKLWKNYASPFAGLGSRNA